MTVKAEAIFRVNATSFAVSPSKEGYTLNYSANGTDWTAYKDATPANENLVVTNVPFGMWYKLVGNNSDLKINF